MLDKTKYREAILKKKAGSLKKGDKIFVREYHVVHSYFEYFAIDSEVFHHLSSDSVAHEIKVLRSQITFTTNEKFVVGVVKTKTTYANIVVEASDCREAQRLAEKAGENVTFDSPDVRYDALTKGQPYKEFTKENPNARLWE